MDIFCSKLCVESICTYHMLIITWFPENIYTYATNISDLFYCPGISMLTISPNKQKGLGAIHKEDTKEFASRGWNAVFPSNFTLICLWSKKNTSVLSIK